MSARGVLVAAVNAGLTVRVDDGKLKVEAAVDATPPAAMLEAIKRHDSGIAELLQTRCPWCLLNPPDGGLDRAGDLWCASCRDAEYASQTEIPYLAVVHQRYAAWTAAVLELSERAGFPRLPFKPGHSVAPGPIWWRRFVTRRSLADLELVIGELRVLLDGVPPPDVSDPQGDAA